MATAIVSILQSVQIRDHKRSRVVTIAAAFCFSGRAFRCVGRKATVGILIENMKTNLVRYLFDWLR